MTILFSYLIAINIFAYIIMWIDKIKAIYQFWRISERFLWILALLGGSLGIFLGMQKPLYHKAGKKRFQILIPLILFFWIVFWIFLLHFLTK